MSSFWVGKTDALTPGSSILRASRAFATRAARPGGPAEWGGSSALTTAAAMGRTAAAVPSAVLLAFLRPKEGRRETRADMSHVTRAEACNPPSTVPSRCAHLACASCDRAGPGVCLSLAAGPPHLCHAFHSAPRRRADAARPAAAATGSVQGPKQGAAVPRRQFEAQPPFLPEVRGLRPALAKGLGFRAPRVAAERRRALQVLGGERALVQRVDVRPPASPLLHYALCSLRAVDRAVVCRAADAERLRAEDSSSRPSRPAIVERVVPCAVSLAG